DTLTVDDNRLFAPDDRILLTKTGAGGGTARAIIKSKQGADKLVLVTPVSGNVNFSGGAARIADLVQGQRSLRLAAPSGLQLNQALPRGAAVSITLGTGEVRIVESSGGDTVTLKDGLANTYSMATESNLPTVASLEFDLVITDTATGKSETFEQLAMNPE